MDPRGSSASTGSVSRSPATTRASTHSSTEARFDEPTVPEARRAIVLIDVERISDSCGYGVPLMSYEGERPHMHLSKTKRLRSGGPDALARYVGEHNAESIDGLPALRGR